MGELPKAGPEVVSRVMALESFVVEDELNRKFFSVFTDRPAASLFATTAGSLPDGAAWGEVDADKMLAAAEASEARRKPMGSGSTRSSEPAAGGSARGSSSCSGVVTDLPGTNVGRTLALAKGVRLTLGYSSSSRPPSEDLRKVATGTETDHPGH